MPLTGLHTSAKINVALSNFSYEISQLGGFVADILFPVIPVNKESGIFWKRKTEALQTNVETLRADGDDANMIKIGYESDSYVLEENALKAPITDRERVDVDDQISLEQDAVATLRDQIRLNREIEVKTLINTTSYYTLSNYGSPTSSWSAASTSIEKDIDTAKARIEANSGVSPNSILIPRAVARTLKRQPEIRDLRKNTDSSLLVDGELPPVLWNLQVIIPGALEDEQKYNAGTNALANVWDDSNVWIGYINPRPSRKCVCFGITPRMSLVGHTPDKVLEWRVEQNSVDYYQVSVIDALKVVDNGCGFLYTSVFG